MAFIPFLETLSRILPFNNITASQVIVQHLTLWIGFVGAIIASNQNKLLSLNRSLLFNEEKQISFITFIPKLVSFLVFIALAYGSWELIKVEYQYPINIAPFIPRWLAQSIMPIGFLLMAINILFNSYSNFKHQLLFVVITFIIFFSPVIEIISNILPIMPIAVLLILFSLLMGAPIVVGLGGLSIFFFWYDFTPIAAIPTEAYRIVVSPTLPTIPLFTLAGYILAESKASERLVKVFRNVFGWIPGGTPIIIILLCGFFTALTGGSGVTILALGGLLLPMLKREGYNSSFSIGLITVSGSLGLLFPPSLPAIIYGVTAGVSVKDIFIGGIIPGSLLIILLSIWSIRNRSITNLKGTSFNFKNSLISIWETKWELMIPVIILIGVFGGYSTIVETASLTLIYVFIIEFFIYKDIELENLFKIIIQCSCLIGGVLIILGVAMGLTSYLVDAQVPMAILNWVKVSINSKYTFLFLLNIFLLIVGCLMDIFSAIIVIVPLITPLGIYFGIDPVHLAIIFIANLELGFLTPPVGMNLFLSAYRFEKEMSEIYRATLPFFLVKLFAVALITYIPFLTIYFL